MLILAPAIVKNPSPEGMTYSKKLESNSKSEYRNPKQIQISNDQMSKTNPL